MYIRNVDNDADSELQEKPKIVCLYWEITSMEVDPCNLITYYVQRKIFFNYVKRTPVIRKRFSIWAYEKRKISLFLWLRFTTKQPWKSETCNNYDKKIMNWLVVISARWLHIVSFWKLYIAIWKSFWAKKHGC